METGCNIHEMKKKTTQYSPKFKKPVSIFVQNLRRAKCIAVGRRWFKLHTFWISYFFGNENAKINCT